MLDGLLGRGFSAKCKSSIKLTKARIDVIRRKRNAMQKYLKKDIADLLKNGLDINAYGRAEGLFIELNLSSCYNQVEEFCGCVPLHLSVMQKQRECPEECKEAVSCLMFAAARFADLPELRDLRDMFSERYGNSLNSHVNQEFVEKLASKPPTVEKKLQLMREVAKEYSIKWDSKAFEQKISNPVVPVQEQPKRHGSFNDQNINGGRDDAAMKKGSLDTTFRGRKAIADDGYKPQTAKVEDLLKRDKPNAPSNGRLEINDRMKENIYKVDDKDLLSEGRSSLTDKYKPQRSEKETSVKRDNHEILSRQGYADDGFKPGRGKDETVKDETVLKRDKRDDLDGSSQGRRKHSEMNLSRDDVLHRDNQDVLSRQEYTDNGFKPRKGKDERILKRDDLDGSCHGRRKHEGLYTDFGKEDTIHRRDNWDVLARQEYTDDGFKLHKGKDETILKRDDLDSSARGRRKHDDGYKAHYGREDTLHTRNNQDISSQRKQEQALVYTMKPNIHLDNEDVPFAGNNQNGPANQVNLEESATVRAETPKPQYNNLPPPYIKPNGVKHAIRSTPADRASSDNKTPTAPQIQSRDLLDGRLESAQIGDNVVRERPSSRPARVNSRDDVDHLYQDDDLARDKKPKPRSVRRRHLKPGHEHAGNNEGDEIIKRKPSRRREEARRGLQHVFDEDRDQRDEEERIMDKMLVHLSKKASNIEPTKIKAVTNAPPLHHNVAEVAEPPRHRSRNGILLNPEQPVPPPVRAISLPPEPAIPSAERQPIRAASFQPDATGVHVHPKLPDYDDLAARFAALRGR